MVAECLERQLELPLADESGPRARFDAFLAFHAANPQVYQLFVRFAREAKQSGREKFGARFIAERIRWFIRVEQRIEQWKYNDHHTPFFARLVLLRNPDLADIFERRDARFGIEDGELLRAVNAIDGKR